MSPLAGARRRAPRTRRGLVGLVLALVTMVATVGPGVVSVTAREPEAAPSTSSLKLLFTAVPRDTPGGARRIYVADGDGTGIHPVTPENGTAYGWAMWALGGTKILYTALASPDGAEDIFMMNPDGTGVVQLTSTRWRQAQPKMAPDGRSVLFTSLWPEQPAVALFRLDLASLQVTSLSGPSANGVTINSDPRFAADGRRIVYVDGSDRSIRGSAITSMDLAGGDRQRLTEGQFFDLDPDLSPDGRHLAYSSYRGEGTPGLDDVSENVKLTDFFLVVRPPGGPERVLNGGGGCFLRPPSDPCELDQSSAYVPRWTPDGVGLGYLSPLSSNRICICVVSLEGRYRSVLESTELAIDWFDWVERDDRRPATAVDAVGATRPTERLLYTKEMAGGRRAVVTSGPDRFGEEFIVPEAAVQPLTARWMPGRRSIVFSARPPADLPVVAVDGQVLTGAARPGPPPDRLPTPPGAVRREHFALQQFQGVPLPAVDPPPGPPDEQIFIMAADGTNVRQLTGPWTEDYLDAVHEGDQRRNSQPEPSPDGRFVYFTNSSSTSRESFLLRLDLATGEVYNLTNATAGAVPTADGYPRVSPDGRSLAFATSVDGGRDLMVVDARDGRAARRLTDDGWVNVSPSWSPDGRSLVYSSYRGADRDSVTGAEGGKPTLPLEDWVLVRLDVVTGVQTVLVDRTGSPALAPVWSPDGRTVRFLGLGPRDQPDLYDVPATGGVARAVQSTLLSREDSLDWR